VYDFKRLQELFWFGLVGVGCFLVQLGVEFDPEVITDWRTYVISVVGAGSIRAFFGGIAAARHA